MLRKQILSLSANYRRLIFATKLKHIGNLCQIRRESGYTKLLSNIDYERSKYNFKLFESSDSSLVLDLLDLNFNDPNLNVSNIIGALTKLNQLCNQQNIFPDQVVRLNFLKDLCALINAKANDMTLAEAVHILDLLCVLKVDLSSNFILHLLNQVNKLLDTASTNDYNRIMQIMEKIPSQSITQTIKTRLVKKFIYKISSEFDQNNPEFLSEAFRFACHCIYNEKILEMIVDALKNSNFESLSPQSILSLLESLNSVQRYSTKWDEILLKAQNAVSMNIQNFDNKDISIMLKNTAERTLKQKGRIEQFYNKILFDKAIEKLISSECNLKDGTLCLDASITVRHTSKELLDYLSGLLYIEMEVERKDVRHDTIFTMLEACADLRYKPFCWDIFKNVMKLDQMLSYSRQKLLYRANHLACLGFFEPKILNKIFESDLDFEGRRFTHYNCVRLYQILKTSPRYAGPWPSRRQIKGFETLIRGNVSYPFYTSLVQALGGPEYVKTSIRTKLFHVIEHVIAFQPGCEPIAINTMDKGEKIEYLEDLVFPENSKVIAITSVPDTWYARNTKRMLGKYMSYFETLETLSCRVVAVNGKEFFGLPQESKTDYLMGLIRKKLEDEERRSQIDIVNIDD